MGTDFDVYLHKVVFWLLGKLNIPCVPKKTDMVIHNTNNINNGGQVLWQQRLERENTCI